MTYYAIHTGSDVNYHVYGIYSTFEQAESDIPEVFQRIDTARLTIVEGVFGEMFPYGNVDNLGVYVLTKREIVKLIGIGIDDLDRRQYDNGYDYDLTGLNTQVFMQI